MFNKLKFNNLVISNKKGIQQSRIQTINKLVHKIRKLKTLLEKHPDDMKCKERINKSTETIELLKKIKRVEIIKKVLLLDKQPAAIITNGLSTPEEVAIALLALNKVMIGLIKRFKAELSLDESKREEWQKVLTETSKRRQKMERIGEKRRKRLEVKQQKILGRKRQEWLEQNCPKAEVEGNDNEKSEGNWIIEELNAEVQEDEQPNIKQQPVTLLKRQLNAKKNKTDTSNKKNVNMEKVALQTVRVNNQLSELEDKNDLESAEEECEKTLVVDPFFITDTGENYLSSAVVKQNLSANENSDEEKNDLHMIKLNNVDAKNRNFKNLRQQSKDINRKDSRINTPTIKPQRPNEKTNVSSNVNRNTKRFSKIDFKSKDFNSDKSVIETNDLNLHPSWAAKQKLKPIITSFQGKKIKFDDYAVVQNNTKSSDFKASTVEQDSLHPSWAAKQKLKPTITAFQGKKIIFNNDE